MGILSLFGAITAMQFEKQPNGYLYRANGKGPGLPVTEEEFQRFVRNGGISFLLHVAAFMLAVVGAGILTAVWFPEGDEPGGFVLMGGLMLTIGYALYRSIKWAMLAPARELSRRSSIERGRP